MFNYYQPTRIHFGVGRTDEIGKISKNYGKRCLLVSTNDVPLQALNKRVISLLEDTGIEVFHFDQVKPNPTIEIVESGIRMAQDANVDFIVALGGGSSIDTSKGIAFMAHQDGNIDWEEIFDIYSSHTAIHVTKDTTLPILSIPTTSGTGSHVTQAAVISSGEDKLTFYHPDLFSKEAIIDPELMTTLPVRMSASTGFDTFTHAFESYVNGNGSYYSKLDSIEAMKLVIEYLPKVLKDPSNISYREKLALADTLGGRALANGGAHTPHPLSEIIGGIANITHGDALAIVYPAYIKHTVGTRTKEFGEVAKLFGSQYEAKDLEHLITSFLVEIGMNKNFSDFEISEEHFSKIINHPVLNFLPFGTYEYFESILNDSK